MRRFLHDADGNSKLKSTDGARVAPARLAVSSQKQWVAALGSVK